MLEELVNYDIIKKGEFVLKSGKQSIYYINLKGVLSYPLLLDNMCNQLANHIIKELCIEIPILLADFTVLSEDQSQ